MQRLIAASKWQSIRAYFGKWENAACFDITFRTLPRVVAARACVIHLCAPHGCAELSDPAKRDNARDTPADTLPDFRNLGVMLRILLGVNAAMFVAAAIRAPTLLLIPPHAVEIGAFLEPALLATVLVLYALARPLLRLSYWYGAAAVVAVCAVVVDVTYTLQEQAGLAAGGALGWHLAFGVLSACVLLAYFRLRDRAFSPALAEARLQALQARIRPHFLFNSLNAVLSLMRAEPRRAESALEDLAELFRNLMADNRTLITFAEEVSLTRQYLNLEHLRLGERLQVEWRLDPRADSAAVPALLLQPLVENAVYHGVEPGVGTGMVTIEANVAGEQLQLTLSNPYHPEHQHRQGNRMALNNIGERLKLHFDVEAQLQTAVVGERFEIRLAMPFRKLH